MKRTIRLGIIAAKAREAALESMRVLERIERLPPAGIGAEDFAEAAERLQVRFAQREVAVSQVRQAAKKLVDAEEMAEERFKR